MTRTVCGRCEMDECRCCRREATYLPTASDRRERIATAVLCGILEDRDDITSDQAAKWAVECADDLIKWLDRPKEEKT